MKTPEVSFLTWQCKFYTENDCIRHLKTLKWPNAFICPLCMHNKGFELSSRKVTECSECHKQTSVLAGTLFQRTHLPLLKWFWSLYFIGSDKGSISALRLSKLIEVNWRTARLILRKVREAMGHRDSLYRLSGTIEIYDAFVAGKQKGKRGRGASGKTAVLVACENREKKAGFIAMTAVDSVNFTNVEEFVNKHLLPEQRVRTDGYPSLNIINKTLQHIPKATPSELVDEWLPWVHIAIGNLKAFLLGTFHGVTGKFLQEYLNEFCYRFNRRFVEREIPNRLLNLAIFHSPIITT